MFLLLLVEDMLHFLAETLLLRGGVALAVAGELLAVDVALASALCRAWTVNKWAQRHSAE